MISVESGAPLPAERGRGQVSVPMRVTLATGIFGGFFSGLLGIGGGTAMVPMLVFLGGLTQRDAHATSLAAMILIATAAVVVYGDAGKVNLLAAGALLLGSLAGARIGADLLSKASEGKLKAAFGAFLLIAAALMVVNP
jgi:uncharacterized membrane protein YfcA